MQKLTFFQGNRGSVLVGAVVICAVLGIAVAGLKGVSRNTVSQEVEAHDDARLFLAAESGLHMLTDWAVQAGSDGIAASTTNLTFNDGGVDNVSLTLAITRPPNLVGDQYWRLASTAALPGRLPYSKTIEWVIDLPQQAAGGGNRPTGVYGAIVNAATGEAGIRNQHFYGRTHFNSPISINHTGSRAGLSFNDAVTMFLLDRTQHPTLAGGTLPGGARPNVSNVAAQNNYTYGFIQGGSNPSMTWQNLNGVFWDGTTRGGGRGNVSFSIVDDSVGVRMSNNAGITRVPLPADVTTLHFGVDATGPYYCRNNCVGTNRVRYLSNESFVLQAPGNLTVSTTAAHNRVRGNVTVETTNNITIDLTDGDLTYGWYNTTFNFNNSDDVLTSGSVADFNRVANTGHSGGGYTDVLTFFSHGDIILRNDYNKGRALTAQLFANGENSRIRKSSSGRTQITLIGTASTVEFWNLTGASGQGTLFGHWFHDTRGLNAYGVELVGRNGAPIIDGDPDTGNTTPQPLVRFNWRETNNPI
jgi:hypothetical protein